MGDVATRKSIVDLAVLSVSLFAWYTSQINGENDSPLIVSPLLGPLTTVYRLTGSGSGDITGVLNRA